MFLHERYGIDCAGAGSIVVEVDLEMQVGPGRIAATPDATDDLTGGDLLARSHYRALDHVAVPRRYVIGVLDLHHPAASALAGVTIDITRLAATVVLVALDQRHDAARRRSDRRIPSRDQVDALVVRPLRRAES